MIIGYLKTCSYTQPTIIIKKKIENMIDTQFFNILTT
jgi:hypothetical protein